MYPPFFAPTELEKFQINGSELWVPRCGVVFDSWSGKSVNETFCGKPIVWVDNRPLFAELATYTYFIKAGWQSRWVETYSKPKMNPIHLTDWKDVKYRFQSHDPLPDQKIQGILNGMARLNDSLFYGCWDVIAWKDDNILFAESKRNKKDKIRDSQVNWLKAGLEYGLTKENFLVVKWNTK